VARIRTIKPEFPHSESMGRVSRDARLTFIELWTIADDSGRLRGNSRMLASLLFPYDDDAPGLIDTWLAELEASASIQRYQVDGASYIQICNWLSHQKIDKPTPSKLPQFVEPSRIVAKPREESSGDLDHGRDQGPISVPQGGTNGHPVRSPGEDPVLRVFDHWREEHNHPKAKLDDKRRKVIRAALKNYPEGDLLQAISGYRQSAYHMGQNETKTKYNDIETMLRDAKHVDMGLAFLTKQGSGNGLPTLNPS
jgi:hypothetical protein